MPRMDTRSWRRAGYLPLADAARALGMRTQSLRHQVDKGGIKYGLQGRYYFVDLASVVAWTRAYFSDDDIAARHVAALREAVKIKHDAGARAGR